MADTETVEAIMNAKTLYGVLGIPKSANEQIIKAAYRKLAAKVHPDRCHDPHATEAFQRLSHAYQTLSNEDKRRIYDMTGDENARPRSPNQTNGQQQGYYREEISPEELFNMIFGNGLFGMGGFGGPFGPIHVQRMQRPRQNAPQNPFGSLCSRLGLILVLLFLLNGSSLFSFLIPGMGSVRKVDAREIIFFTMPDRIHCETLKSTNFQKTFYVPSWWINEKFRPLQASERMKIKSQLENYADDFWFEDQEIKCEVEKNNNNGKPGSECKAFQRARARR